MTEVKQETVALAGQLSSKNNDDDNDDDAKYNEEVLSKISRPARKPSSHSKESIVKKYINDMNKDWKTPGDRELREITLSDGLTEELYFVPDKYHHKKVFTSFTIHSVDIDQGKEAFRAKFYLQFNWIPTEKDYKSLYDAAKNAQQYKKPELLTAWEPSWKPTVVFENVIEMHRCEWKPHPLIPEKGPFRQAQYKQWGKFRESDINVLYGEQDFSRIKWFCAELECDVTFREEFELQSYPFDVQDLSILFRFVSTDTVNYSVFALPNYFNADVTTSTDNKHEYQLKHPSLVGCMDPSHSQLDEWDVQNCLIEFKFKRVMLSLKLSRRYTPVLINTSLVFLLMSLASFATFAIAFEDASSRLELTMTLILTAVLFDTKSSPKPYLTYLDKYTLMTYLYLTLVILENGVAGADHYFGVDETFDIVGFWVLLVVFLTIQIGFIVYAYAVRKREMSKVQMGYDEVKKFNQRAQTERKKVFLFEKSVTQKGINKYHKCYCVNGCTMGENDVTSFQLF